MATCGTDSGYQAHRANAEDPCGACRAAHNDAESVRRRRQRAADRASVQDTTAAIASLVPKGSVWLRDAACGRRWDLMQSTDENTIPDAKRVCYTCPVLDTCRGWLLSLTPSQDVNGVAGGWTAEERKRYRRRLQLRPNPVVGEPARECRGCGETKPAEEFYPRPTSRGGGREAQCIACRRAQNRAYKAKRRAAVAS